MELKEIKVLIEKYNRNEVSEEERNLVIEWYDRIEGDAPEFAEGEFDAITLEVYRNLERYRSGNREQIKRIRLWPKFRIKPGMTGLIAAAAVVLIVFGIWFFNSRNVILNSVQDPGSANTNDIGPGKNGATITLANGKVIQLSDAKSGVVIGDDKLAYNDNTVISSATRDLLNHAEDLTASTAKGQTYIFTLPDGTKVWLNAASSLTIPSGFSGTESRTVELSGEAYFEVFKDKKRPFIVKSAGQEVTVLGTHFNINSYTDEGSVKTTLLEGSVRVSAMQGGERNIVLKPNQQSVITSSDQIQVKEVNPTLAVAWKNNEFMFERESIENIMKMVERWYNVEVIYRGTKPTRTYSGSVSRFDNVSRVLHILELSGKVHFTIEGRRIYVSQ